MYPAPKQGWEPARKGAGVRIRKRRNASFWPWAEIEERVVIQGWARKKVIAHYGMSGATYDQRSYECNWPEKRRQHSARRMALTVKDDLSEASINRKASAELMHKLKKKVAEKYMDQLSDPDYRVNAQDLVRLERLEQDLREPGWDKPKQTNSGGGAVTNNFLVLAKQLEQRAIAIDAHEKLDSIDAEILEENPPSPESLPCNATDTSGDTHNSSVTSPIPDVGDSENNPPTEYDAEQQKEQDRESRKKQANYRRKVEKQSEDI